MVMNMNQCSDNDIFLKIQIIRENRPQMIRYIILWFGVLSVTAKLCKLQPSVFQQIQKSLSPFSEGITTQMIEIAASNKGTCRITIKNKELYDDCFQGGWGWICFFKSIAQFLPDMTFILNLQDEARVLKNNCTENEDWRECACDKDQPREAHGIFVKPGIWRPIYQKVPLFGPTTIPGCFLDILIPSHLHLHLGLINQIYPWEKRQFKAVWRGSTTGGDFNSPKAHFSQFHRHKLVAFCSKLPDCDAKFATYLQCRLEVCVQMRKSYGYGNFIPIQKQMRSKIIIDIDGNTYSARFPLVLSTGSAIFKMKAFEDYGSMMAKPFVHYVPVKMDLSDFESQLKWARDHDDELEQIGRRGRQLAFQVFNLPSYKCYVIHLLLAYHKLLR